MGKYLDTLIQKESILNEISENYILESEKEKVFADKPTLSNPQKVQKGRNSTDKPTLSNPQKVQKSDSVEARRARLRALNSVYGVDGAARKVVRRWRQMQKRAYDEGERARRDWESVHPATRHDLVVCALLLDANIDPRALAE